MTECSDGVLKDWFRTRGHPEDKLCWLWPRPWPRGGLASALVLASNTPDLGFGLEDAALEHIPDYFPRGFSKSVHLFVHVDRGILLRGTVQSMCYSYRLNIWVDGHARLVVGHYLGGSQGHGPALTTHCLLCRGRLVEYR